MDKLEMIVIDAQLNALVEQRNNAMNQVVNLVGELARVRAELKTYTDGKPQDEEKKDVASQ